jgi:hypothetical protein
MNYWSKPYDFMVAGQKCFFELSENWAHTTKLVRNNGAFTLDVNSLLNENLGDILGGTQC